MCTRSHIFPDNTFFAKTFFKLHPISENNWKSSVVLKISRGYVGNSGKWNQVCVFVYSSLVGV